LIRWWYNGSKEVFRGISGPVVIPVLMPYPPIVRDAIVEFSRWYSDFVEVRSIDAAIKNRAIIGS
jgi:hypothetical protein